MSLLIIFGVICAVGFGSSYWLGNDNPIEEQAEEIIEDMIDVSIDIPGYPQMHGYIDLSPSTPENPRNKITKD